MSVCLFCLSVCLSAFFLCVCICVRVCMCVHACVHVCINSVYILCTHMLYAYSGSNVLVPPIQRFLLHKHALIYQHYV